MKNSPKNNKKLIKKIIVVGGGLILIPLAVLIVLLTVAFLQLKGVHNEYHSIVKKLHTNLDEIDTSINRDTNKINKNQEKTQNVNRQFGLHSLEQQMRYSAGALLFRISGLKEYNNRYNRSDYLSIYVDKVKTPKDLLVKLNNPQLTTKLKNNGLEKKKIGNPAIQNDKKLTTSINKKVLKTESNSLKKKEKVKKSSKTIDLEKFIKKFKEFRSKVPKLSINVLKEVLQNFILRSNLGYESREIFIIEHKGLHEHNIIWSTETYWRNREISKIKELKPLYDQMISMNYLKHFLKFQDGISFPSLLFKLKPLKGVSYTDAKYSISKMEYFAIIPIFGTSFSLGLKTPLKTPELQALDNISTSLGDVSKYIDQSGTKISNVDKTTMNLHRRFNSETEKFGRTFIFMLIISFAFVVILSTLIIINMQRGLVNPIIHLSEVAKKIHEGEFETRCNVHTNDELEELAANINAMLDRIVLLIRSDSDRQKMQEDILSLLETVSQASKGDLTVRGEVETAELQAINDAFNHMMTSIGALVINVRKSGIGLEQTSHMLLESLRHILEKATKQATDLDIASRKIKALGDRSQEITRMVDQIGNIAMETRTLALNATLEASRAGDRDSGISHLAEHVRQLSEGLEKTRKDIESFIGSIQLATNYAVQSVEDVLNLTRTTRNEAEQSYISAEKTYHETEELGRSISLFRVKTPKDKEKEIELQSVLLNIVSSIKNIRLLVNTMDTKEFESLNVIIDDFEKDLNSYGLDFQLMKNLDEDDVIDVDVPAFEVDEPEDI